MADPLGTPLVTGRLFDVSNTYPPKANLRHQRSVLIFLICKLWGFQWYQAFCWVITSFFVISRWNLPLIFKWENTFLNKISFVGVFKVIELLYISKNHIKSEEQKKILLSSDYRFVEFHWILEIIWF